MNQEGDFDVEDELERVKEGIRKSEWSIARSVLEIAFVLYMMIRHPGAMGRVIVVIFILVAGSILWVLNEAAYLVTGIDFLTRLSGY
jgi:hypothetical protein